MSDNARTYPTYPIPAVGAIILEDEQVLLIQRGKAPAKGKWTIPGGVIEVGESPEEALVREIQEECHLEVTVQDIVKIINRVFQDEEGKIKYHYVILDYLVECRKAQSFHQFPLQADSDVMNIRWVPLRDLKCYDLTEGLIDVINAAVTMNAYEFTRQYSERDVGYNP